ncbi:MAG TPA: hypothetical protein VNO33_14285, partial [Kofleriaceae bacterium]|nr:hypothetical protein [Kofleriaceae bacterium]
MSEVPEGPEPASESPVEPQSESPVEQAPESLRAPDRRSALGSISELLQRHELAVVALVSLA